MVPSLSVLFRYVFFTAQDTSGMRTALRSSPPPVARLFFGIPAHTPIQLGILLPETQLCQE